MIDRHPPVYWLDHRNWYYPFPYLAGLLFVAVMGLDGAWPHLGSGQRRLVRIMLAALVCGNLLSLPRFRSFMSTGRYFSHVIEQSGELKTFLRTGVADSKLSSNYKEFGQYVETLREEVRAK